MAKPQNLGHLAHIVAYNAENHITVPAGITMHTNQLVASQAWVTTALGSYALSSSLSSYVPTSRTITINGTTFDLSANRSWDITSMIYPAAGIALSTGSAWGTSITNNSANWNTAFGWGNHASAGYLTGITSLLVTNALGFTPYNSTNPAGYVTASTVLNAVLTPYAVGANTAVTTTDTIETAIEKLQGQVNARVPSARTLTINGTTFDLSADRTYTISTGTTLNGTGFVKASGTTITYDNSTYLTGITSALVTGALGFTPYNATNPAGYITGISFANVSAKPTTLAGYGITDAIPSARTITINGTTWDLSANRSFTVTTTETDTLATVTSRGASTSTAVVFSGNMSAWNTTTPGTGLGTIQIGAANGNTNFGGAITFAARDGGGGSNAQAGIYVVSDGSYGTRMYFATTDAYVTGSKTAMSISETGVVNFVRANATVQGNALIHAGNIGSQSVASASNSTTTSQTNFSDLSITGAAHKYLTINPGNGYEAMVRYIGGSGSGWYVGKRTSGQLVGTQSFHFYSEEAGATVGGIDPGGVMFSVGAMRAPIFYDHNDTGYYLDPNSESSLYRFTSTTMTRNAMNYLSINSPFTTRAAQAGPYQNGTMGWGTTDFNTVFSNWGSGFIDTWSSPGNAPGGSSHYVGIQSCHYNHQNSANVYGFQIACAGEADNRFFWRSAWPSMRGWVEMIHTGNIGSQSVSYANSAGNVNNISSAVGGAYTWTGINYFETNNGGQAVNNSNSAKLQAFSTGGNSAFMSFHRGGYYAVNMGLDNDNVFRIGGWSAGPNRLQLDMSGNMSLAGACYAGTYRGNANVGGTGEATYHPAGVYCDSTMWQYGAMYKNNTAIHDVMDIYNRGWFRNYGDSGLYNQDYGCHLRRNSSSSYGAWEIFGYTKGGYIGLNLIDPQGYWSNLMFENGSGGIYQQNGQGWLVYFYYGNDCLGLSGSETYDWVRACTNGKHRITNDTWCDATSWAYTFSNISDGRLKENIVTVDSALEKVLQLRGVYYNWIIDTENKKHIGLIAQETAAVCPEVVNYHEETDTYSVNYSELSGLFVESTKELNQKLMDANARIELLESKLNQLLNA